MIEFKCPECKKSLRVRPQLAGQVGKCTGCGVKITVPSINETKSAKVPQGESGINKQSQGQISPPPLDHARIDTPSTQETKQIQQGSSSVSDGLGLSSLIVGILSFFVCWVPFVNFGLGGLGFLLGIAGLARALQGRGHGIGYSIAGTAVSSISFLVGILYLTLFAGAVNSVDKAAGARNSNVETKSNDLTQRETTDSQSKDAVNESEIKDSKDWTPISETASLGSVSVRISESKIAKIPLVGPFSKDVQETPEEYLIVRLSIMNNDPNKKINYRGWMSDLASLTGIKATLTDEHGNRYKFITTPAMHTVQDAESKASIYPQKEIRDAVVFESPVPTAKKLFLTLTADGCEQSGEFRFEIPTETFGMSAPQQLPKDEFRTRWINDTYKSSIIKVRQGKWQEIRDETKEVVWNLDELDVRPEYVELFLIERMQKARIYEDRLELFIDNNWINAAYGRWGR